MLAALLIPVCATAGEVEMHNTAERITGTWGSSVATIILGPAAHITVDGDWFISAAHIYIHPTAHIDGAGVIHLMSPATYGAASMPTTLDAGGVLIGCRLSLENNHTITLAYIDPAVLYPEAGFIDMHPNGSDNLVMGNRLNFGNTNAHLRLNASDLVFTADTMANFSYQDLNTAGYALDPTPPANAYQAYVTSNGATGGVITKLGLAANEHFRYPLGQSAPLAAPYDYTPADITNTGTAAHDYSVRVTNYAESIPIEGADRGMDRTWEITAEDSASAHITLTHNDVTGMNIGTDGSNFNPMAAYITQYDSTQGWSVQQAVADGGTPVNVLSGTFTVPHAGSRRFFSKTSDIRYSLPVKLIRFDAVKTNNGASAQLLWEIADEGVGVHYEVLRSTDGRNFFTTIAQVNGRGTTGKNGHYVAYDYAPVAGDNFYCLKILDASGHFQLSNVRKVRFEDIGFERAVVAPNPLTVESKLIIRVREEQQVQYSIVTVSGTVMLSGSINATAGEASYTVRNLDLLPAGTYLLKIHGTLLRESLKLLKRE